MVFFLFCRTRSELSSALEKKLTTVIFPSFKAELVEMLEKHKVELNESIRSIPSTPFGAVEQEDTTALRVCIAFDLSFRFPSAEI